MAEISNKELIKAIYNGGLDVLKLVARDWNPKARYNFYMMLERLKKK